MKPLRFAVLGTPISHSRSPAMHGAAYAALGMPHVYEKLETTEEELPSRVAALRDGTYAGFNVTVPHKVRVLSLVDEVDASAADALAANTLVRLPDGRVRAHNTDVPAIVSELARLAGGDVARFSGTTAILLGSGGAARAAVSALVRLGVRRVLVRARGPIEASFFPDAADRGVELVTRDLVSAAGEEEQARIVVQATSCGMAGGPPGDIVVDAVRWDALPADAVVLDVVYGSRTPLLDAAAARGLACDGGLGMLATQGALAFSLWLGTEPPIASMRHALGA